MFVRVHTEKGRKFRLFFPVSLNIFRELLDCLYDLTSLACIFTPKTPRQSSHISVHTVRELLGMLIVLLGSINEDGPYELVNVDADKTKVSIKIS